MNEIRDIGMSREPDFPNRHERRSASKPPRAFADAMNALTIRERIAARRAAEDAEAERRARLVFLPTEHGLVGTTQGEIEDLLASLTAVAASA